MKYKRQHKQLYNVVNSFLLYYHGKAETILNYKGTFGLIEGKKYKHDTKASSSQREQYGGTVHLFIGTEHSPCKITSRPFTFANNFKVIHRGLNSISLLSRFSLLPLCRSSLARIFGAASTFVLFVLFTLYDSDPRPKAPVHISHSENIVKLYF
jgi:hypothetical protein